MQKKQCSLLSASLIAASILLMVPGCSTVVYDMGPVGSSYDTTIERDVINRLREDDMTGKYMLGVTSINGTVTIRGSVPNEMVRSRVVGIALGAPGVREVIDEFYP